MKKTIAMMAVLAATSSASALIGPGGPERENICVKTYKTKDASLYAGGCDETRNNKSAELKLKANGCAKGQVSLSVVVNTVGSCLPAGVIQL